MIYFWVVVRSYRVQLLEEKINQVVPWTTTQEKPNPFEEEEIVWKTVENLKKIYSVYAIKYLSKKITVYSYNFNLIWKEKIN